MLWFLKKKPSDKRRFARVPFPTGRSQMVVRSLRDGNKVQSRILDISAGGVRLRGDSRRGRLYKGDGVQVDLMFSMGEQSLALPGEVVWLQVTGSGIQYEAGIRFRDLSRDAAGKMQAFIKKVEDQLYFAAMDDGEYVL
jgi:c-di-GMP-binding flagellar brake protein YcgR